MMHRRAFITAASGLVAELPRIAGAQPAGRVYCLGILDLGKPPADPESPYDTTVLLRELGYLEGQNLVVERRYAEGKAERMPGLVRELADLRLDAIHAIGGAAIRAAKCATATTPIILLTNGDVVAAGLVQSLTRTGANITGVLISPHGTLAGKRLELLHELAPQARRIALLMPDDSGATAQQQVRETRAAAASISLGLDVVEVRGGDYARAFTALAALRPSALVVGSHLLFMRDRKAIIELVARTRLPAIYEWPRQVKEGGLMSYGANDIENYVQVASYIDRIFNSAQPADLPVWHPSKLHLVINRNTAKALGITLPQSLLLRADEVVEWRARVSVQTSSRTGGVNASRLALPAKPLESKVTKAAQARLPAWCSASAKSRPRFRLPTAVSTVARSSTSTCSSASRCSKTRHTSAAGWPYTPRSTHSSSSTTVLGTNSGSPRSTTARAASSCTRAGPPSRT